MANNPKKDIRICLLSGNYHYRKSIISKIKKQLNEFDLSVYDSQDTYEYVVSQIFAASCFSNNRLIILTDWPKFGGKHVSLIAKFKKMVADIPHDCLVILDNLPKVTDKFVERINEVGKTFLADDYIKRSNCNSWVRKELAKRSKTIESTDVNLLVESVGISERDNVEIDRLLLTITKLCHFVGNRKIIRYEDVLSVCFDSSAFIIWSLFNFLDEKDINSCLPLGRKAIINNKNVRSSVESFLHLMIWRYKLLLCLKDHMHLGWKNDRIVYDITQFRKFKRNGSFTKIKMEPDRTTYSEGSINASIYKSGRRVSPIEAYSRRDLYKIMKAVYKTLLKVRTGCSDSQIFILWYSLLMTICGDFNEQYLDKIRRPSNAGFY